MHHNLGPGLCDWRTPKKILDRVRHAFAGRIDLDPASAPDNPTDADTFLYDGGLECEWHDATNVFLNPPWSRKLGMPIRWWVARLWDYAQEQEGNCPAILICPASVNTQWFHHYVVPADAICFPKGRLVYDPPPGMESADAPTFDSAIAYYGEDTVRFHKAFRDLGWIP